MNKCVHVPLPWAGIIGILFAVFVIFGLVTWKFKLKGFLIATVLWMGFATWFITTHTANYNC